MTAAMGAQLGWHPCSRRLQVGPLDAHLVDCGPDDDDTDTPALLLHGFICSSWTWRHNLPAIARQRRVLAPCLKGFGWTERAPNGYGLVDLSEFILRLMDAAGVERAHLVGNSLGGAISLWLAHAHPERVGSLVLLNPAAARWRLPGILFKTQKPWLSPLYRMIFRRFVVQRALRTFAYRQLELDRAFMDAFMAPLRTRGTMRAALAVAHDFQDSMHTLEPHLDGIEQPSLLIHGRRDPLVSLRDTHKLSGRLRGSRVVVFEGAGHCPHEEDPTRFNAIATRFMASAEGGDDDGVGRC